MYWKDVMEYIRDKRVCPFYGRNFHGWISERVKEHLIDHHPKEMLEVFEGMVGCSHYCPFHRGGRHLVQVRCDQTYCHECGKELEKFRINFTAGFIAKMSLT